MNMNVLYFTVILGALTVAGIAFSVTATVKEIRRNIDSIERGVSELERASRDLFIKTCNRKGAEWVVIHWADGTLGCIKNPIIIGD